jgi:hypothetical protein
LRVTFGTIAVPYTQTAGALVLMHATLADVTLSAGELRVSPSTFNDHTQNLSLAPAVRYIESIAGDDDFGRIGVTGAVALNNATLTLQGPASGITPGRTFIIIANDGNDAVIGTFAGLPEGATILGGAGGMDYAISYSGGDGNDVVLTAVSAIAAIPTLDPRMLAALAVVLSVIGAMVQRR